MSTPKLSERLRELRASMEMGTSDIMPRTWTLLDDCIALAQVQGSSGQEGPDLSRSAPEVDVEAIMDAVIQQILTLFPKIYNDKATLGLFATNLRTRLLSGPSGSGEEKPVK